jgi:hypothetical protein
MVRSRRNDPLAALVDGRAPGLTCSVDRYADIDG